jgi:hypothetical protein
MLGTRNILLVCTISDLRENGAEISKAFLLYLITLLNIRNIMLHERTCLGMHASASSTDSCRETSHSVATANILGLAICFCEISRGSYCHAGPVIVVRRAKRLAQHCTSPRFELHARSLYSG